MAGRLLLLQRLLPSLRLAATGACAAAAGALGLDSQRAQQHNVVWCDGGEDDGDGRAVSSRQHAGEDRLRAWHGGLGSKAEHLNRGDLEDVDRHRHVVAMIGITGGGKSSTANTLMSRQRGPRKRRDGSGGGTSTGTGRGNQNLLPGNRNRRFREANSLTSVTRSVSFRDYEFSGVPFRVIDTPGLADTNRSTGEIETELDLFKRVARHGVTAFVIVLPRGRITGEDEHTLQQLFDIFGPALKEHAIVVFTSCLKEERPAGGATGAVVKRLVSRDVLLEEIDQLEPDHFLRRLVVEVGLRVVGVENKLEPHRTISCVRLNQLILDVDDANEGRRYNVDNIKHSAEGAAGGGGGGSDGSGARRRHGGCTYTLARTDAGEDELVVRCPPASGLPQLLAHMADAARD